MKVKVVNNREEKEKYGSKILPIERRRRNFSPMSWKSRREREILLKNLDNREEKGNFQIKISRNERGKRNFSTNSWKSRGERDMKISFSRAREKNLNHFSSRISRDRDSCQCLFYWLADFWICHRLQCCTTGCSPHQLDQKDDNIKVDFWISLLWL